MTRALPTTEEGTGRQQAARNQPRDAQGQFACAPMFDLFDLFPSATVPEFAGDERTIVPLEVQPIDGDGNCLYNAFAHVLPPPLFANRPHHQATPVEAQRAVRTELSNFLAGSDAAGMVWPRDPMFTRMYPRRAAGQEIVVTPQQFAHHMLEEGMEGHWGENFEGSLFARRFHRNVAIVVETHQVDLEAREGAPQRVGHHQLIYPVLEHGQPNNFHLPGRINNAYPTLVLRFTSTLYGTYQDRPNPATGALQRLFVTQHTLAHYDVVRSFQLAPPNTHEVVPGADVFLTDSLRVERERQQREVRFTASGSRVRSVSTEQTEERDASVGPARRRRGRQAKTNPLQSDHVGDSSYVYRYSATASKNFSHDFPPAKSFQPVTTQRMTNDSNSFYRAAACMLWGDEDRWPEVRQRAAEYLLEQWQSEAYWTGDERFTRLYRIDAEGRTVLHDRECTPDVYAADLLDEAHPGTDAEWFIVTRAFGINVVSAWNEQVEGREEIRFDRYPVLEPHQENELADRLEPKRDTGVVLFDGTHVDVVTSYKIASEDGRSRANAQLKRCIAQPDPKLTPAVRERVSTRTAAVEIRERMERERQRQYEIDQQRQQEQAARERSNLPHLDPPQGQRCHTRDSHRNAMAGCAGRDVNHAVEYFNVGGFTQRCPWNCGALYLKSEHDKLAKPRGDGTAGDGLMAKCCRNGRTDTEQMRTINKILSNPPPIIRELSDPEGAHPEAKAALRDSIKINSHFAFASVSTVQRNAPAHGVQPIIANGEFRWRLSDIYPPSDKADKPAFAQYYVLPPQAALERRMESDATYRPSLSRQTMEALDNTFRANHPLAGLYHNAAEMHQQSLRDRQGQPLPEFEIILLTNREADAAEILDPAVHVHRTELPIGGGQEAVALIWINDQGTVNPIDDQTGIRLHGKEGGVVDFHHFNPNIFAACYPYLNPYGIQGYRYGMRYKDTPTAANPEVEVDPNAVFGEDEPDEAALVVDPTEREHLPKQRQFLSARDWHNNTLAFRDDPKTGYQWAHWKGPLTEQYVLVSDVQIQQHEQEHRKDHQKDLRSVLPKDLLDSLQGGLPPGQTLGKVFMATKHWKGSRSHMQQAYSDAMTMFNKLGTPQLFLTFTANPSWPEIKQVLKEGQSYNQNPAAVTRIFWEKWEELKKDIVEREIFGPVKCFVYSVEHQKRGMPHIHMLITLDRDRLDLSPQFVDNLISAEIPAEPDQHDQSDAAKQQRKLRELVRDHQMHTCSDYCLRDDGTCEKRFPREFSGETVIGEGYTQYKRRGPDEGGELIAMRGRGHAQLSSNQFVVPYNPFLLIKYGSHHNLEWVGGYQKALEYTLKYLLKGGDMAYVQVNRADGTPTGITDYDEIKHQFKVCYRTAMQAMMNIQGRPVTKASHTVHKLWVHSPASANMIVEEGREEEAEPAAQAAVEAGGRRTMLTAFFERCAHPESDADIEREGYVPGPKANELLFEDFPRYYHFDRMSRSWIRRKRLIGTEEEFIARIGSVNPRNAELTAIRILLQNTKGPTSWNDLKTVRDENGDSHTFHPTDPERGYHDAAVARGLLENNVAWIRTLEEADRERMGCRAFRRFFASTLVHSIPPDRQALFDHFIDSLTPRRGNESREQQTERAYQHLEYIFRQWDTTCRNNGLRGPTVYDELMVERDLERAVQNEPGTQYVADDPDAHRSRDHWRRYSDRNQARFNAGQRAAFDRVLHSITDPSERSLFRLKGEGGTGKTFVYNTLIAELRARGEEVIVTGTTGVAATLLLTGRTAHSAFRIPIDVDSTDAPRISGQEQLAQRLRRARVIIIDEMTMMNKDVLNYIDRTLRSLYTGPEKELPYAGKAVCISGDWKQRLPIVKGERRPTIVKSTIKYSETYPLFETLTLTENMRIDPAEREYQDWTRLVGNGLNFTEVGGDLIEVDERNLVPDTQALIDFVFPPHAIADPLRYIDEVADSAVLCYTNNHVDRLNAELMSRIAGEEIVMRSIDRPLNVANNNAFNIHNADLNLEHIHAKTPGNMPPHELRLKKSSICLLLMNLDIESGLCNGTRLMLLDVKQAAVEGRGADQLMPVATCRVLSGKSKGKLITLIPSRFQHGLERNSREAPFERLQLPIKPAFVMTADKAQGQTLNRVGLYLADKEAFSHGHVYVPITRIKKRSCLKILPNRTGEQRNLIRNVVWPEVLDPEDRLPAVQTGRPPQPPPPPQPPTGDESNEASNVPAPSTPAHAGDDSTPPQQQSAHRPPDSIDRLAARRSEALSNAFQRDVQKAIAAGQTDKATMDKICDEHAERAVRARQWGFAKYSDRLVEREAAAAAAAAREAPGVKRKNSFIKRVGSALFGSKKKVVPATVAKKELTWAEAFAKNPSLRDAVDLVGEEDIRTGEALDTSIRPDALTLVCLESRAAMLRLFEDDDPMEVDDSTSQRGDDDPPPSTELCELKLSERPPASQVSAATDSCSRVDQRPSRPSPDFDSGPEPENPNKDRLKSSPDEGDTVQLTSQNPLFAEMEKQLLQSIWTAKADEEQQRAQADAEEESSMDKLMKRLEESEASRKAAERSAATAIDEMKRRAREESDSDEDEEFVRL